METIDLSTENRTTDPRAYSLRLMSMLEKGENLSVTGFRDLGDLRVMSSRYVQDGPTLTVDSREYDYRINEAGLFVNIRRVA